MNEIQLDAQGLERLMLEGDLSKLTTEQRVQFYKAKCEHVGLDPSALPFQYIRLQGKLTLYASKGCAEQLRKRHNISLSNMQMHSDDGLFTVTIDASTPDGRSDTDCGSVYVGNLNHEALANAKLKAVTKAKRRVTLSLLGLGMLDETEVETIKGAEIIPAEVANTKQLEPLGIKTKEFTDNSGQPFKGSYHADGPTLRNVGCEVSFEATVTKVIPVSSGEWNWFVIKTDHNEIKEFSTFSTTMAETCIEDAVIEGLVKLKETKKGDLKWNAVNVQLKKVGI